MTDKMQVLVIGLEERISIGVLLYEDGKLKKPYGDLRETTFDQSSATTSILDKIQRLCTEHYPRIELDDEEFDRVAISHCGMVRDQPWGKIDIARIIWEQRPSISIRQIIDAIPAKRRWTKEPVILNDATAHAIAEFEVRKTPEDGRGDDGRTFAALRIGEGINCGVLINGNPVRGQINPEIGHLRCPPFPKAPLWNGACPVHGNCAEGLISFNALREFYAKDTYPELWALKAHDGKPAPLDYVAFHVAFLLSAILLAISPRKIVLVGGDSANSAESHNQAVPSELLEVTKTYLGFMIREYPNYQDMTASPDFLEVAQCGAAGNVRGIFLHAIGPTKAQKLRGS